MSVATQQPVGAPVGTPASDDKPNRLLGLLELPSVGALFLWMIVPLGLTVFYSFIRYSLLNPDISGFAGFENYQYLIEDEAFWPSIINTVILVGSVLVITIVLGTLLAVLYDREFFGKNVATLLVIAPPHRWKSSALSVGSPMIFRMVSIASGTAIARINSMCPRGACSSMRSSTDC